MLIASTQLNIIAASNNGGLDLPWHLENIKDEKVAEKSDVLSGNMVESLVPAPTLTPTSIPTPEPVTTVIVTESTYVFIPTPAPVLPTAIPTPIPTSTPIPAPTVAVDASSYEDRIWDVVQNWRTSQGLSAHAKDSRMCRLAELRLPEIKVNWSHDQFMNNAHYAEICPGNNCFSAMSENLSNGYYSEQENLNGWLNSPLHKEALQKNYTYSCIKCSDGYCVQEFAS